jgi:E3 ubiquitin-protein ligase HECTD2
MASSSRSRGRPPRHDLVTRIHSDALETPTHLFGALDISNNQAQAEDSSSSESDTQRLKTTTSTSRHGRSMSNPFPSFLGGPKKRRGSAIQVQADPGHCENVGGTMAGPSVVNQHKRGGPAGSKDFATGTCMTCASLMRWPRELKVFKCTICTTINDLVIPASEADKSGFHGRWRERNAYSQTGGLDGKGPPNYSYTAG